MLYPEIIYRDTSRKGVFFPGMMYHRETKQFSNIIVSLIFNGRYVPPNSRCVYGRKFNLISPNDINRKLKSKQY